MTRGRVFSASLGLFGFVAVLATAVYLATDRQPSVDRSAEMTPTSIERATQILRDNDPRELRPGERKTITVAQEDLDLAANYVAQRYTKGSARVRLNGDHAALRASMPLSGFETRLFLNVSAVIAEAGPIPRVESLSVGSVPIPSAVADWLVIKAISRLAGGDNFAALMNAVKEVRFRDGRLAVTYEWQTYLKENIRSVLLMPKDRERVRSYQERLSEAARAPTTAEMRLPQLISRIFELAEHRSRDGDPVAENRAAILVLALYVNYLELAVILPEASEWERPVKRTVTLGGRDDFAKHFIVSAILAAKAGAPLADAVGVYKELADARGGSGFSFNDIAADRAGTRFGEKAVESAAAARRMQAQLSRGVTDAEILPAIHDLPEFMSDAEFKRRFGGIDAPQYRKMMSEIERRVGTLALYR